MARKSLLKITSLTKDKTFVSKTRVLIRNPQAWKSGHLIDEYTDTFYFCNIQPGSATNSPSVVIKDSGESEQPRIAVYSSSPLALGDFIFYGEEGEEEEPYRVIRIEPWSRHGHYYVTAIRHIGPQGARSSAFVIT